MSIQKINPRYMVLLLIIVIVAASRLAVMFMTDPGLLAVFTPIGAMALFGGAYFNGRLKPFAFPLLALFFSDVVLSFTVYSDFRSGLLYTGWYWTYSAFALMALAGKLIIKDVTVKNVFIAVIATVLIHWLISDIGGCLQEKGTGAFATVYLQRLITAIPHELQFFAGTLIYSSIMFGFFEWIKRRYPKLAI